MEELETNITTIQKDMEWEQDKRLIIAVHNDTTIHTTSKVPIGAPAANASSTKLNTSELTPYCLWNSFYGRTGNRIFSLARIWHRAKNFQRPLALNPSWTKWYLEHFDPPIVDDDDDDDDDRKFLLLNYCANVSNEKQCMENKCYKRFRGEQAYRMNPDAQTIPELSFELIPKASIREYAERILHAKREEVMISEFTKGQQNPQNATIVTVHRRNFEGVCTRRAGAHRVADFSCPTQDSLAMCRITYSRILDAWNNEMSLSTTTTTTTTIKSGAHEPIPYIWLFTDYQVPDLDDTFPHRFNATNDYPTLLREEWQQPADCNLGKNVLVEMWIMAKSDLHWGNPESTMDQIVYHWRNYQGTYPQTCFSPIAMNS